MIKCSAVQVQRVWQKSSQPLHRVLPTLQRKCAQTQSMPILSETFLRLIGWPALYAWLFLFHHLHIDTNIFESFPDSCIFCVEEVDGRIEVGKSVKFLKLGFNKACQVCVTEASVSEINALMCSTSIFTKSLVENSY